MTNGDRIRGMCDGDFADWFVKIVQDCKRCPAFSTCDFTAVELDEKEEDPFNYCVAGFEKWLKEDAE